MSITNDEKAVNMSYTSPIHVIGKNRKLGRTNKRIVIELRRLYTKEDELSNILDNETFEKAYEKWECDLNKILSQILTPWQKSEIKELEIEDIEDILREISRRKHKRRGLSDDEIAEIEEADHRSLMANIRRINSADPDFQS